jgi:glutamate formiminotransferase
VLDTHVDADHNRAVVTLAGFADALLEGALGAIAAAVEKIDLSAHAGVHPRVGAADVVPFVPLGDTSMQRCIQLAHELGERVWSELHVPVFFYRDAALKPSSRTLARIRTGRSSFDLGDDWHPRAGAVCIGARPPLVAYNVHLVGATYEQGAALARLLRQSAGGMRGVQALAFVLGDGSVQLSMNLVDLTAASPTQVFAEIQRLATEAGFEAGRQEVVGLCPAAVAPPAAAGQLLEGRLAAAAAQAGARECRERTDDEHQKLAAKLEQLAPALAQAAPDLDDMLRAAEQALAARNVLQAGACLTDDSKAMLETAAAGLRAAVPASLRRGQRLAALDRWLEKDS